MKLNVNYGKSVHGKDEINAVLEVLKTSTQMGKNVKKFENRISKLFNKKYGLMVNSGSSALLLAFEALKFPKNSEVITPILTFSTSVAYIVKNNLTPVFVDVKKDTFCVDEEQIKKALSKKTVAIVIPNLLGNLPNWLKIKKIINQYNKKIIIIEDSADCLGSKFLKKSTGHYSDVSITSFYGSHIINCAGNGGYIGVNNKFLYNKIKLLRSWGRSSSLFDENSEKIENRFNIKLDNISYDKKFVFDEIGHNLEPSEIGAAFGLAQLQKLKKNLDKRKEIFKKHKSFFSNYPSYFILPSENKSSDTGWLAYPIIINDNSKIKRKDMQIFLEKLNIQTRVIFTGNILRQPGFKNIKRRTIKKKYDNADYVMSNGILIGCHQGMTNQMVSYIHQNIKKFIKKIRIDE